jgi:hypothetical protein
MGFPLFALAAAAVATLGAVAFGAILGQRVKIARRAAVLAGVLTLSYVAVLWAVNSTSSARVLRPGEPEALCGAYLDCHVEVSVTGAEPVALDRPIRIVTLELSSSAQAATIEPPPLALELVDRDGRRYGRDRAAEAWLGLSASLRKPLEPGAVREVRLAFALPEAAPEPRLRVRLADPIARAVEAALVGDSDGLFHAPVLHALDT